MVTLNDQMGSFSAGEGAILVGLSPTAAFLSNAASIFKRMLTQNGQ